MKKFRVKLCKSSKEQPKYTVQMRFLFFWIDLIDPTIHKNLLDKIVDKHNKK